MSSSDSNLALNIERIIFEDCFHLLCTVWVSSSITSDVVFALELKNDDI